MNAESHVRQAQSHRAIELAQALDTALLEYGRRYGSAVLFQVDGIRVTARGVEFTVIPG